LRACADPHGKAQHTSEVGWQKKVFKDETFVPVVEAPVAVTKAGTPKMPAPVPVWGPETDYERRVSKGNDCRRVSKNSTLSKNSDASFVGGRASSKMSLDSRTAILHNSNIYQVKAELQELKENQESSFEHFRVMARYITSLMQKYSVPLVTGVIFALIWANVDMDSYDKFNKTPLWDGANIFGHKVHLNFLVNDIFMCFFFGLAIKEVAEALLPGGSLSPFKRAINPLFATLGGVFGPIALYAILVLAFNSAGAFDDLMCQQATKSHRRLGGGSAQLNTGPMEHCKLGAIMKGWGVPTATDISLAWMFALMIFGAGHPVINFLLLLAILDDAIGMVIIAVFYPDPLHPVEAIDRLWLCLVVPGVGMALLMRRINIRTWVLYIICCAPPIWVGLLKASVHPALTLVFVVPAMPAEHAVHAEEGQCNLGACDLGPPRVVEIRNSHLTTESAQTGSTADTNRQSTVLRRMKSIATYLTNHTSEEQEAPMHAFEDSMKMPVDFGMFFFGLSNAGVKLNSIGGITYSVLFALLIGKTLGITLFSFIAIKLGFALPEGVTFGDLVSMSALAGIGLTVALFVSNQAFVDAELKNQSKMGAVLSVAGGLLGWVIKLVCRQITGNNGFEK